MRDESSPGLAAPDLLLRELLPADEAEIVDRLKELGWMADHLGAWAAGAPAVVLYDPVDGCVLGAGLASGLGPGTYQLLAAMVAGGLMDRDELCERIVSAVGDRIRRLGGVHLAVPLQGSGLSDDHLAAMGFDGLADAAGSGDPAVSNGFGVLEL